MLSPSGRVNITPEADVFLTARGNVPHSKPPRRLHSLSRSTSLPIFPRDYSAPAESPTPRSRLSPPGRPDFTDHLPPRPLLLSSMSVPNFSETQAQHSARKHHGRVRRGALVDTNVSQSSPAIVKTRNRPSPQLWSSSGIPPKSFPGSTSREEGFRIVSQPAPRVKYQPRTKLGPPVSSSVVSAPVVDWARMKAEHEALKRPPAHRSILLGEITERTRRLSLGPLPVQDVHVSNARRGAVGAIRPSRSLHSLPSASRDHFGVEDGLYVGAKAEYSMTSWTSPTPLPSELERDKGRAQTPLSSPKDLAKFPSKSLPYAVRSRPDSTSPSLLRVNRRILPIVEEEIHPEEGAADSWVTAPATAAPSIRSSGDKTRSQVILRPPLATIYLAPTTLPRLVAKGTASSSSFIPRPAVDEQYDDDDSDKENNWLP